MMLLVQLFRYQVRRKALVGLRHTGWLGPKAVVASHRRDATMDRPPQSWDQVNKAQLNYGFRLN